MRHRTCNCSWLHPHYNVCPCVPIPLSLYCAGYPQCDRSRQAWRGSTLHNLCTRRTTAHASRDSSILSDLQGNTENIIDFQALLPDKLVWLLILDNPEHRGTWAGAEDDLEMQCDGEIQPGKNCHSWAENEWVCPHPEWKQRLEIFWHFHRDRKHDVWHIVIRVGRDCGRILWVW